MGIRLWLARRLAPGGWHVQRDPVRRKVCWAPKGYEPWSSEPKPGTPVQFQRDLDAVFDPSLGNGAP